MASANDKNNKPSRLADIRVEAGGLENFIKNDLLGSYWPSVPGAYSSGAAAATDCMAVLLRTQWARVKNVSAPKGRENALAKYSWLLFDPFMPDSDRLVEAARSDVVKAARRELGHDFSFLHLCRSGMAIEVLWERSRYQLTYTWILKTKEVPLGKPAANLKKMAKTGFVFWDGVRPATIQDRINKISKHIETSRGVASRFFQSPALLQVDFRPGKGCDKSLDDLFQFSANKWVLEIDEADSDMCEIQCRGEQAYILRAAVKHRQGPTVPDSIRSFQRDGTETVPPTAADLKPPDWGFTPAEGIPTGVELSLFYEAVGCISPGVKIHPYEGPRGVPRDLQAKVIDFFEEQAAEDKSTLLRELPVSGSVGSNTP